MHAATVTDWAEGPKYRTVEKPTPKEGEVLLKVLATGLHNVVRFRAKGVHYSAKILPHTPGIDFVGLDEATGKTYYASMMKDGFGTFAEYVAVPQPVLIPVPEGVDPVQLAASVNPGFSSWMAITQRTQDLPKDWTALILGVTSASGRLAVSVAKTLGAAKVIGAARSAESMATIEGLDQQIVIQDVVTDTDFSNLGVDVVLDYVYGDVAIHMLTTLKPEKPVQFVQIGDLSGTPTIPLPSALLRSTDITMRGAGPGGWQPAKLPAETRRLIPEMAKWKLIDGNAFPFADVEKVWNDKSIKGRIVFTP